jgi:alpha-beta hydrolase superfamily lysophospholipase
MSGTGAMASRGTDWVRKRRWWLLGGFALFAVVAIGAAVSWHFSSAVLVPHHDNWPEDVTVVALEPGRIVLSRSEESERPGVYGLDWQAGHAVVGPVLRSDSDSVTRRLRSVSGYLARGMDVAIDSKTYSGDPGQALGLPFSDVRVPGELGPMPAWEVPGSTEMWAIIVHGINDNPQTGLRIVPALHRAGLTSLLITYREDLGAPSSPDGLHHMGLTEWRDLEAAARYALDHGARYLVLVGYSMGGSLVTQFIQHSSLTPRVVGLVLDAPVLDWKETISFNATEMGLPSFSTTPVEWAIGARIDADWDDLDALQHTDDFSQIPVLLFHGGEDDVVPISTSEELAEALPGWATLYRSPRAGHTEAWNVNPPLYEERLTAFLSALGPPTALP